MYDPSQTIHVISNACKLSNGLAPIKKNLNDRFGIESAGFTTVHAHTNPRKPRIRPPVMTLRDAPRGCGCNIVLCHRRRLAPSDSVIPELKGKFSWNGALRTHADRFGGRDSRSFVCPHVGRICE